MIVIDASAVLEILARTPTGLELEAVLLDAVWPDRLAWRSLYQAILQSAAGQADILYFRSRPGLDGRALRPWAVRRKLGAPCAYAKAAKGAEPLAIEALERDDSDYVAWGFD